MARATKVPSEYDVQLILTATEAKHLMTVAGNIVGGGPGRVAMDAIYGALNALDVPEGDQAFDGKWGEMESDD